mmetsp:Transcript_37974/g.81150  ORF Transcript_37974/g.81150 Transcript_37974/m.81150 type:complete len:277 (-) Transcript_37974:82-912(-)
MRPRWAAAATFPIISVFSPAEASSAPLFAPKIPSGDSLEHSASSSPAWAVASPHISSVGCAHALRPTYFQKYSSCRCSASQPGARATSRPRTAIHDSCPAELPRELSCPALAKNAKKALHPTHSRAHAWGSVIHAWANDCRQARSAALVGSPGFQVTVWPPVLSSASSCFLQRAQPSLGLAGLTAAGFLPFFTSSRKLPLHPGHGSALTLPYSAFSSMYLDPCASQSGGHPALKAPPPSSMNVPPWAFPCVPCSLDSLVFELERCGSSSATASPAL